MSQLHQFAGNVALPLDGRFGFGQPGAAGDEPTGPQILVSDGDPNGTITAPDGTLALDPTTVTLWQNSDGGTTWIAAGGSAALPYEVIQQRVELVDLPGAATTGFVGFGGAGSIPANRMILGMLAFQNAFVDVGGSGISAVELSLRASDGTQINVYAASVDLVGQINRWIGEPIGVSSFLSGLSALEGDGLGFYKLDATGGSLDTLDAFDITVYVVLANLTLTTP